MKLPKDLGGSESFGMRFPRCACVRTGAGIEVGVWRRWQTSTASQIIASRGPGKRTVGKRIDVATKKLDNFFYSIFVVRFWLATIYLLPTGLFVSYNS